MHRDNAHFKNIFEPENNHHKYTFGLNITSIILQIIMQDPPKAVELKRLTIPLAAAVPKKRPYRDMVYVMDVNI